MAVDTQKLFYLLDPVFQIENLAGKPVVGGHIEVFVAGTDTKYITWQDWGGARNPFKIPLKSDGRAVILVEPQYTFDVYIYDSFNNMVCSRLNVSPAIGGDVSVTGLTQVFHDETISGNGTPQEPIGVVSAGKVYEGIDPIVVNNTEDKISANHVPLGVQDPLYFVQDDEEGCIIGFSGQTVSANSAQWAGGTANPQIPVTGINGIKISESADQVVFEVSANYATEDWVTGQGYLTAETDWSDTITAASANAYNEATAAIPTGLATTGDLQTVSGEITALIPSTAGLATEDWVTAQGYLTASYTPEFAYHDTAISSIDNSALYDNSAHARINTLAGRISDLSSNKLDTTAFSDVSGTFLTAHQDLSDYQTTAGMTAYQPVGDYVQGSDLSLNSYDKISAISGHEIAVEELPDGVMVESGLEYDNTEISGYSGSAFKDVALTDVVTANSGVWGGSALPISAGPGIKFEMIDNTLVASVDETVLASSIANEATAFTLSEEAGNFERLRLYDTYGNIVEVAADNSRLTWVFDRTNSNGTRMNRCYTITSTDGINWNELNVYGWNQTAYTGALSLNGGTDWYLETHKIIGINRIAGE